MKNLSQKEWSENISKQNIVILDVRTPKECAEGIIEGALMIDIMDAQNFMKEVETLDKSKNYYVYCRSGGRSEQACQYMSAQGFKEANNLIGGMLEWKGSTILP